MITQQLLHELFEYQDDGNLYWKHSPAPHVYAGSRAGSIKPDGKTSYIHIWIEDKHYYAHRLIWLYYYGKWPDQSIDHIDGNGMNNKLNNLREVTRTQNKYNMGIRRDNLSGFKGVTFDHRHNRYRARIKVGNKRIHLGYFENPEDAARAYKISAKIHHGAFYRET